ncbi:3-hydroxyacyl-CoA dehydrogenase type-2-like [Paramacrobiotus metropolitanus]|uniref:3-hydroxyacyl-CoA dehydrogenase type-2-like n=1 Tax=Paramacrobiotus metropolitanus TaxID=2943436 RepID=UPI002445E205|nr:3-hydroxyacyl-CoA dehydrogenase type-2-like [Paramacrobiotus metropolitanus]
MHTIGKGFVAIVTGGASGLGKAAADFLASQDATVFVVDLPKSFPNGNKDENNVHFRGADITSEEQITTLIQEIRTKYNRLDCVVNCAGICSCHVVFDTTTDKPHSMEDFMKYYQVNVFGTFNVIRLSVALMRDTQAQQDKKGPGVIITVSSVTMYDAPAEHVAYSSCKAAVAGMTVPLAREFSEFGIRVVDIAPGPMLTPMLLRDGTGFTARACLKSLIFPVRPGQPEEFADAVRFIVENPFINGTTIRLDGGYRNPMGSKYAYQETSSDNKN